MMPDNERWTFCTLNIFIQLIIEGVLYLSDKGNKIDVINRAILCNFELVLSGNHCVYSVLNNAVVGAECKYLRSILFCLRIHMYIYIYIYAKDTVWIYSQ